MGIDSAVKDELVYDNSSTFPKIYVFVFETIFTRHRHSPGG